MSTTTTSQIDINHVVDRLTKLPNEIYELGEKVVLAQAEFRRAKFRLDATEAMVYNRSTGTVKERESAVMFSDGVRKLTAALIESEGNHERAKLMKEFAENEFIAMRKVADIRRQEMQTFGDR